MAGVKGRSGGAREGGGRKPKTFVHVEPETGKAGDVLKWLIDVAFGRIEANATQVRAAVAAVQYTHTRRSDGGKKDAVNKAAKEVAGRFSAATAPKLVAAGGKKV